MRHLFSSRVEVLRLRAIIESGAATMSWAKITEVPDVFLGIPGEMMGRLDLNFMRPGKDQPMAVEAGRAPDRVGVFFCSTTSVLKAGDRIRGVTNPITGLCVVQGTFEIRTVPDVALDFATGHHIEVQVIEVAQSLAGVFPAREAEAP